MSVAIAGGESRDECSNLTPQEPRTALLVSPLSQVSPLLCQHAAALPPESAVCVELTIRLSRR